MESVDSMQAISQTSQFNFFLAKLDSNEATIEDALTWLSQHGQSITLNFGEDTGIWECSWITGGHRMTGEGKTARIAIGNAMEKCFAHGYEP